MIFNRDKKLSQALEQALEMKKNGKNIAEIVKNFPGCVSELESLLKTAAIIEKEKDNVLPTEDSLREVLTRMETVTKNGAVRYSFTEESIGDGKVRNLLLNFNQAFMSKKVYAGGVVAVFLLAIIVGVGWYNFSQSPKEMSLQSFESSADELSAEIDYLVNLSNDPFADLDGDLQKINSLANEESQDVVETTSTTKSASSAMDASFKSMESEFSKFENDLKALNTLGEGESLEGINDTLSTINEVF